MVKYFLYNFEDSFQHFAFAVFRAADFND